MTTKELKGSLKSGHEDFLKWKEMHVETLGTLYRRYCYETGDCVMSLSDFESRMYCEMFYEHATDT